MGQNEMQPADTYATMAEYEEAIAAQIDEETRDETLDEYIDSYDNEETEHYDNSGMIFLEKSIPRFHTLNAS